ncbi:MAG TPA: hypothetical protein VK470_05355, partial [Bacteroidota bacterium]|nr:hypothetical protein [Bacteroidota bacterium]
FTGCSKTYQILLPETAQNHLEHENGTVTLSDSQKYDADNIRVFGDSLTFMDTKSERAKTVALHDIAEVNRTSYNGALLKGAAVTLAALCIESSQRANNTILHETALAGVIGTLWAACCGSHEKYIFNRDSLSIYSTGVERDNRLIEEYNHEIKHIVKYGIALNDCLIDNSGSFSNVHGVTAGYPTGIDLYSKKEEQYVLVVELNYNKMVDYRRNVKRDYFNYHHVSDEKYELTFLELGILPEYLYTFNDNFTLGFYAGGSIGIGGENQYVNELSRTIIDPTFHGYFSDYGPYGETSKSAGWTPYSISFGSSLFYKWLMIDVRYRYTHNPNNNSYVSDFSNVYLQFGIVL